VFDIDREHPEYKLLKGTWKKCRDLYAGGDQFHANATEYLIRRHREPLDVYYERLQRVFYENYLGSIIDWYAATLFRREPILSFQGQSETAKAFYGRFVEDCDLRGTSLTDFFRKALTEAMVCGKAYVLVDFPRTSGVARNRAEEEAAGTTRAYLVECSPQDVINWSHDEQGNLEWAVIRTAKLRQKRPGDSEWVRETKWVHYDKEAFRTYRRVEGQPDASRPELVDEGRHGLARLSRVPLIPLTVSDGLWLANKASSLQLEHFNKSNSLAWAMTVGLFAMPVIFSDKEFQQVLGESYYLKLGKEDRFGWTEPAGNVFQIAADNLVRLKDEIYRSAT